MNDRNALDALRESPGFLLQELGIGSEVFVYRPYGPEERSGFVACEALDEDIANRGRGFLFRKCPDGDLAIIRLYDKYGILYRLLSLEFDYTCPSGRMFFLGLRGEEERQYPFFCPASRLQELEMQANPLDNIEPPCV